MERIPNEPDDEEEETADDPEPCYRDGSLQNECWRSDE